MKNNDFYSKVFEVVRQIPVGKVTTYGAIAKALGIRSSARAVGWALNSLAGKATDIPAHRVVNRLGELSGARFFDTPTLMRELLENEGIEFEGDAVDLSKHLWEPKVRDD
jgi:methylated-DNA-protein-cysteine methyltransferase-like protein